MLLLLECMLQLRDSLPGHQIILANSLLVWRHHRVHHRGMRQLLGSATLLGDTELLELLLRSKVLLESSTQLHGRMPLGCMLGEALMLRALSLGIPLIVECSTAVFPLGK